MLKINELLKENTKLQEKLKAKIKTTKLKKEIKNYEKELKILNKEELLIEKFKSMNKHEEKIFQNNNNYVVGIDEVGRGCLAGPLVVAAVIFAPDTVILGLDDSKKISPKRREELSREIKKKAIKVIVKIVEPSTIDQENIYQATKNCMTQIIKDLPIQKYYYLVDAMPIDLEEYQNSILSIIKGDQNSNTIAAASIIAKVKRDQIMKKLDEKYPNYNFKKNKGYGTKEHISALEKYGITKAHRKSYGPVKKNE